MNRRIGLIVIATGKYLAFVQPLLISVKKHFLVGDNIFPIVLTDATINNQNYQAYQTFQAKKYAWPQATLYRWHQIMEHAEYIKAQGWDYVYHFDADMRCVAPVTDEIIGTTVGTMSPIGYWLAPEDRPYFREPLSAAYVASGSEGKAYYTGSLNGGIPNKFFELATAIVAGVDQDDSVGIMAPWHEESHLNAYYAKYPPEVTLSPEFCCPQGATLRPDYARRIILTIDKPDMDCDKTNKRI